MKLSYYFKVIALLLAFSQPINCYASSSAGNSKSYSRLSILSLKRVLRGILVGGLLLSSPGLGMASINTTAELQLANVSHPRQFEPLLLEDEVTALDEDEIIYGSILTSEDNDHKRIEADPEDIKSNLIYLNHTLSNPYDVRCILIKVGIPEFVVKRPSAHSKGVYSDPSPEIPYSLALELVNNGPYHFSSNQYCIAKNYMSYINGQSVIYLVGNQTLTPAEKDAILDFGYHDLLNFLDWNHGNNTYYSSSSSLFSPRKFASVLGTFCGALLSLVF